jgi:hypothetical protein
MTISLLIFNISNTQHDGNQSNDILNNINEHNSTQHNTNHYGIQHDNNKYDGTQHNGSQHNGSQYDGSQHTGMTFSSRKSSLRHTTHGIQKMTLCIKTHNSWHSE